MGKNILLTVLLLCLTAWGIQAQPPNDNCLAPIQLTNLTNWCSDPGEFSNIDATFSANGFDPFCFPQGSNENDVWFAFTAQATDVNISVIGNTGPNGGGTLENPQLAIYSGNCGNLTEIQCASDGTGTDVVETFAGPLIIGQTYLIQVDARNGNQGTFQLCINNFNQIPEPSSDCPTGVVLCDKSPFTVESVLGNGLLDNEVDPTSCIREEISSVWYKWTCDDPGSLTFTLTPNNPTDDLDFALYELPNGIEDCSDKILLRCMASGENIGAPFSEWEPCTGPTGLSTASNDVVEFPGCDPDDDNFVSALDMESGKSYALVINNFSNTGNGFGITFGGSGTFLGPTPGFFVDPPLNNMCDVDVINFFNESELPDGFTATYEWNFGNGANPGTITGDGPHEVVYNSFGTKSILLRVVTDQGCVVTDIQEIFIEPCCDTTTNLTINLDDFMDPICFDDENGSIDVSGSQGTPAYEFSIDGINFQALGSFINLGAGMYDLFVQDIKGCRDSLDVTLVNPPPIIVDAGPDQTIDLGFSTSLNGQIIQSPPEVAILWDPSGNLDCNDCLDPVAFPFVTTEYFLTATDSLGCRGIDSVTINVNPVRPVYIPNVFTPNFDGINDYFTAYGGPAAELIRQIKVFDRWGDLVFEADNIALGAEELGWDGTFRGKRMNSGVFAYFIEVVFLDGQVGLYKGDVTLLR